MDTVDETTRSRIMARVRNKHTSPEMLVRRMIHKAGYRFCLHRKDLPGRPDLVFPGRRKVIFVNGCFWHRHEACRLARLPKSRQEFWIPKLEGNRARDHANAISLAELGWDVLTVWECELRAPNELIVRIRKFLDDAPSAQDADDGTNQCADR